MKPLPRTALKTLTWAIWFALAYVFCEVLLSAMYVDYGVAFGEAALDSLAAFLGKSEYIMIDGEGSYVFHGAIPALVIVPTLSYLAYFLWRRFRKAPVRFREDMMGMGIGMLAMLLTFLDTAFAYWVR
jgi:hypothetical protein